MYHVRRALADGTSYLEGVAVLKKKILLGGKETDEG
jgi:hypothetical protein